MPLQYDLHEIVNGANRQTNFASQLLRLIFKADQSNRAKLKQSFPNAVRMVEHYLETGEILELPYD